MKKNILICFMLVICMLFVFSSFATAIQISYYGGYNISNLIVDYPGETFSETLNLEYNMISLPTYPTGVAFIGTYEPVYDAVFSDPGIEYIKFNTVFTLDQNNYVSGEYYNFNPNNYVSAFSIYDDDHTELLSADLSFARIDINNTVGNINSSFSVNLTNINPGIGYIDHSSIIIDDFLNSEGGSTNLTLQFNKNLGTSIEKGENITGTFSGTASPVPEPATMLLLGIGLIGMAGAMKRKFLII